MLVKLFKKKTYHLVLIHFGSHAQNKKKSVLLRESIVHTNADLSTKKLAFSYLSVMNKSS